MHVCTTEAIVLRTYNLAEADRIVVCFTRDVGLIRGVAKGARRMKSRFGAALEPFTVVNLEFREKENRELVTITAVEILKSNFDLAADVECTEALGYMAELVSEFAPPHEANEKLFRMVHACLEALAAAPQASKIILRYFEIWILRLAGSFPEVTSCAVCGKSLDSQPAFLDYESAVRCGTCSRGVGTPLATPLRQIVLSSHRLGPADFAKAHASIDDTEIGELNHRLIVRALQRLPRMMVAPGRA